MLHNDSARQDTVAAEPNKTIRPLLVDTRVLTLWAEAARHRQVKQLPRPKAVRSVQWL